MSEPGSLLDVPYSAQWESPELVADIIAGRMSASEDPLWFRSGARDRHEYEFWSWRACGMACLKMALRYWTGRDHPLVVLAKEATEHGAYIMREDSVDGLIYRPFTRYVVDRFGLGARSRPALSLDEMVDSVEAGSLVMASVHPHIRWPGSTPPGTGGHLVLVLGHAGDEIVLHNPSGDRPHTQAFARVRRAEFVRYFAGRGIILSGAEPFDTVAHGQPIVEHPAATRRRPAR